METVSVSMDEDSQPNEQQNELTQEDLTLINVREHFPEESVVEENSISVDNILLQGKEDNVGELESPNRY